MAQIIIDIDTEDLDPNAVQNLYEDIEDVVTDFEIEHDTSVELEIS